MSPWIASITSRACASLRRAKHRAHTYEPSITNSGSSSLPFLSLRLRNAGPLAGLLVQPTANADPPSGWLVLSTFVGLPIALWAYKVRLVNHFQRLIYRLLKTRPGCAPYTVHDARRIST